MIEDAYTLGASLGLAVWCEDEAGPFQTVPHPGTSWQPEGRPARQPHEYVRNGTAKVLTLFRPSDGRVCIKAATSVTNAVLHPWVKRELAAVLAALPAPPPTADASRAAWEQWQVGLALPITLPEQLPALRVLLVLDNLAGHKTPAFVLWLFAHGVMGRPPADRSPPQRPGGALIPTPEKCARRNGRTLTRVQRPIPDTRNVTRSTAQRFSSTVAASLPHAVCISESGVAAARALVGIGRIVAGEDEEPV